MPRTPAVVRVAALSALAVGSATLALPATQAGASDRGHSVRAELLGRTAGHGSFGVAAAGGVFFGTPSGHPAARPADVGAHDSAAVAATAWMRHYGQAFGIHDAARDLHADRVDATRAGTVVHLQQAVSGLPVVGGEMSLLLDGSNNLVSAAGHVSSATAADPTPAVSADTAKTLAVRAVAKTSHATALTASEPVLSLLDQELLGGPVVAAPMPVWVTTVTSTNHVVRHDVYVEAMRGGIVLNINDNPNASRIVCTAANRRIADPTCPGPDVTEVSKPWTRSDRDKVNAYRFAKAVDLFYSGLLGRNSLDDKGMELASTVHYCPLANDPFDNTCPYDNAFWDGREMVYGTGLASALDVVGHEMTHGVTEHTSHLFSYYQSGAINESQSDVMGELIQQIEGPALNASGKTDVYDDANAWQIGEEPDGKPVRYMDHPENDQPHDPDSMTSSSYDASGDDSGGVHANAGVGNKAAFLIARGADGDGSFNGLPITGVTGDGNSTPDPYGAGITEDEVVKDVKTANVYYLLDKMMVGSSTYADVYKLLPQACDALVGKSLTMPGGWSIPSTTIVPADCAQVRLAVKATRMNVPPTKSGAVIPTAAPYCNNGGSATGRRTDAFEINPFAAGSYGRSHSTATNNLFGYKSGATGAWWWVKDYQQRGSKASLWGDDTDPIGVSPNPSHPKYSFEDARAQKAHAIRAAVGTYVRFATAWGFETETVTSGSRRSIYNFDGGVVEYSIDGGRHWRDAGALFVDNGYNGRVTNTSDSTGYVDPNPLKGRRAFVRSSHGWTASRLDLSSLKDKSVLLRWRVGADEQVGDLGWFVDNVQSYSCNPTHVSLSAPPRVPAGHAALVTAHLVRAGSHTVLAGLPVTLWEKRHSDSQWIRVSTHTTNKYGNVRWSRRQSVAYDYRVRMPGQKPFAPSNFAGTTVRIS